MNEIFIDLGISAILTTLKKIAKDEKAKRQWKKVMLKIANAIKTVYSDDEDFQ